MNRNTRTLVVVALAVVLASLASYGVYRAITRIPVREVPVAARNMVVAARPVPVGGMLAPELVKVVPWPANAPVTNSFQTAEEVLGRGVIAELYENEPITESKLAPRGSGAGLVPTITPGMRAVSVRVNSVISVAGYTTAGTYVDVVVTLRAGQESQSRVVLSNVRVLAADKDIDAQRARQQGTAQDATIVTLLLTPQDVEKLTLAQSQGQIALALRNPMDTVQTETTGARMATLLSGTAPPPVQRVVGGQRRVVTPPPPPPPPPPTTVKGIRGSKISEVPVKCC